MNISKNTILVTGGATGIGLALAEEFVKNGNTVIICGRRTTKLEEAKEKIPGIHTRVCDVGNEKERTGLIEWTISNFPGFNMLVNNAGIQNLVFFRQPADAERITSEVMINLVAPVHLSGLVFPHFSRQKEPAILNVTSGLGYVPIALFPVYCATKAAMHSFTLSLRHQVKGDFIRVFEIIPPTVDTELDHGSRRKRGVDPGIPASVVATETIKALLEDRFEIPVGQAANLVKAWSNPDAEAAFKRMNG